MQSDFLCRCRYQSNQLHDLRSGLCHWHTGFDSLQLADATWNFMLDDYYRLEGDEGAFRGEVH